MDWRPVRGGCPIVGCFVAGVTSVRCSFYEDACVSYGTGRS